MTPHVPPHLIITMTISFSLGLLYDKTEYYPSSFYLSGCCMVLSGLLMFPTYMVQRRKPGRQTAMSMELQVMEG